MITLNIDDASALAANCIKSIKEYREILLNDAATKEYNKIHTRHLKGWRKFFGAKPATITFEEIKANILKDAIKKISYDPAIYYFGFIEFQMHTEREAKIIIRTCDNLRKCSINTIQISQETFNALHNV